MYFSVNIACNQPIKLFFKVIFSFWIYPYIGFIAWKDEIVLCVRCIFRFHRISSHWELNYRMEIHFTNTSSFSYCQLQCTAPSFVINTIIIYQFRQGKIGHHSLNGAICELCFNKKAFVVCAHTNEIDEKHKSESSLERRNPHHASHNSPTQIFGIMCQVFLFFLLIPTERKSENNEKYGWIAWPSIIKEITKKIRFNGWIMVLKMNKRIEIYEDEKERMPTEKVK